ncbi:hypothetical protein BT96DRAFT_515356 [Gymnopus androsaceus JB14]|uniref:Uncharacterized protein n=1 Tax=Gymnopus androsaceus JB14 TaxID=1447944 RepID=A0A6A4I0C4_9AGAR|nr:hypothetical protein BT96DRAFT_515356 [Gymnopus androsaceus JB14]
MHIHEHYTDIRLPQFWKAIETVLSYCPMHMRFKHSSALYRQSTSSFPTFNSVLTEARAQILPTPSKTDLVAAFGIITMQACRKRRDATRRMSEFCTSFCRTTSCVSFCSFRRTIPLTTGHTDLVLSRKLQCPEIADSRVITRIICFMIYREHKHRIVLIHCFLTASEAQRLLKL